MQIDAIAHILLVGSCVLRLAGGVLQGFRALALGLGVLVVLRLWGC